MDVRYIATTSGRLSELAIVDGQLIYLTDLNATYYDMGSSRRLVSSMRVVSSLPSTSVAQEGVIYGIVNGSGRIDAAIWDAGASTFRQMTGYVATTSSLGLVKPDGTTITIDSNGTISCQQITDLPADHVTYDNSETGLASTSVQGAIGDVKTIADNASSAASTALSTAQAATSTASTALSTAQSATSTAENASTTASSALTIAQAATSTASDALSAAQSATSIASTASIDASNALTAAQSATSIATDSLTAAQAATSVASDALIAAQGATSTADDALTAAQSATSIASNASTVASDALNAAQSATSVASTALTTAQAATSTLAGYESRISALEAIAAKALIVEDNNS